MSNLLKSKFLLGLMIVSAFAFTVAVSPAKVQAADCTITKTLKMGSRGDEVKCLQSALGLTADGKFGKGTKAAVMAFQTANGLTADGIFGRASRTAWMGGDSMGNGSGSGSGSMGSLCPNGMTLASNCTMAPVGNTGGNMTGPVSVMLTANNPASGTLVSGQSSADLLHVTVMGTGTVTNMKFMRTGVSTSTTLSNVYLFDGATRLTDAATVNSLGEINFNAPSGLFSVSGMKNISVIADVAGSTSGQTVGVSFVSGMMGTTALTGTATGNLFTIASVTGISTVSFATVTPSGATINPAAGVTLWQSTATVSNHDTYLDRIAFRQIGSAPVSSFANFKLYVNGVVVATATGLDSNGYVTFVPTTPLLMTTGARTIRVDADVVSGASRTIQLSLRTAADAGFRDSQLGVHIAATTMPVVASSASTISGTSGGTMTIEKDISSPSQNVVLNGHDVLLGTFKATAYGEPVKIETLRVGFASSDVTTASLSNGHIMIAGAQYGSSTALVTCDSDNDVDCDGSDTTYTSYTLNYVVTPGVPAMIEVRADVDDSALTAGTDTITAVVVAGSSNAVRQDSLGTFSSPSSAVAANALTVQSASLTLAKNTTYASQTTVVPQTGYKLASYNLSGSSVEDVLLSTLSFDVDEVTNATFNEDDLTNVYVVVKNGSTVVAQPAPLATLSSGGQDNNFSISYTLLKNQNVTIELFGTIGSTITAGDSLRTDLTVTGTSLVSGVAVTATSADTIGQTISAGSGTFTATATDLSTLVKANVSDSQTVTTSAFKFAAVNSGYTVTDLVFSLGDSTAVQSMQLYDGSTMIGSQTPTSTTVTFAGLSWMVPANANPAKVLTVKLVLSDVGYLSGTSGAAITTTLTSGVAISSATGGSAAITESNPAGNAMYQFAAVPMVTMTSTGETIGNGSKALAKFTVSSSSGTIAWNKIKFTTTKTSAVVLTSPVLNDSSGQSIAGTFVTADVTNSDTACDATALSCTFIFLPDVEQQVSTSASYTFKATVASAVVGTDSISTNVANPTTSHSAPTYGIGATANSGTYFDADDNGAVSANDIRQVATTSVVSAYGQTNTGVATFLTSNNTDEVQSYGTVTNGQTIILTETGAATNIIGSITGTLVSTGGFTCTAYDTANGGGSSTTTIASILSVKCVNSSTSSQVILNTSALGGNGGVEVTTITLTTSTYSADTLVVTNDSDVGLDFTGSTMTAAAASFVWSDNSAQSHSTISNDWNDDYLVKNLPLDTYTLQ